MTNKNTRILLPGKWLNLKKSIIYNSPHQGQKQQPNENYYVPAESSVQRCDFHFHVRMIEQKLANMQAQGPCPSPNHEIICQSSPSKLLPYCPKLCYNITNKNSFQTIWKIQT